VTIQKQPSAFPLKALFNPGSDLTLVHQRCLPPGVTPLVSSKTTGNTPTGNFAASHIVTMDQLCFLSFIVHAEFFLILAMYLLLPVHCSAL
jgi:hypothetical protein